MFAYYLDLALRGLRRNAVLTILMVVSIGVGIGASMTTLTVFRSMDGDPIPGKSAQLFAPQIDNWGPVRQKSDRLEIQLTYTDSMALLKAHAARRQTATYTTGLAVTPANPQLQPFRVNVRAATSDFFPMFQTPFRFGSQWSSADDDARAQVAVISKELNERVFGGADSVGKMLNLDNRNYRIVGVLDRWEPVPKFYDLTSGKYSKSEEVFLPFNRAIEAHMEIQGSLSCKATPGDGWDAAVASECIWTQFWVELPTPVDARAYRAFLANYASDQRKSGRFDWLPRNELVNVKSLLRSEHVVSDEVQILVLVSFSFFLVCLLNAMGLLLAKIMGRSGEIGVRRALGANRRAIFAQCLIEAGVIGMAGGLLGLLFIALGLQGLRAVLSEQAALLTHLDALDVGITLVLAVGATMIAGLYPTWRAAQVQPAWQLKAL